MIRHALLLAVFATSADAAPLRFPGNAEMTQEQVQSDSQFMLPTGGWDGVQVPTVPIEGTVTQQAWRVAAPELSLTQILRPLREQLRNANYDILFECETLDCGGFDFRFDIDVLRPPYMFVNLSSFRQLSAWRTLEDGTEEAISLLVSRSGAEGYVQLTHVGPSSAEISVADAPALRTVANDGDLATNLTETGRAVLLGLTFERGSARLADEDYAVLQELADFLSENSDLRVALVGHTDAEGSLDGNIALSKRRAASVLERLVEGYSADRQRMEAQGMGYLSPIANNQTEAGREANRRVEVIITSTN